MADIASKAAGMTDQQLAELWIRCRTQVASMTFGGVAPDKIWGPDENNHPKALRLFLGALADITPV